MKFLKRVHSLFYTRFYNPLYMAYMTFRCGILQSPLVLLSHPRGQNILIVVGHDKGGDIKPLSMVELSVEEFKTFLNDADIVCSFVKHKVE